MSLDSPSRSSILRRGPVVLATAATLFAGGPVGTPAAQAVPLVNTSERDGTVVTTRMQAEGAVVEGNTTTNKLYPVPVRYDIDLGWTGGELRAFDGVITLQRVGSAKVRRFPVTVNAHGYRSSKISLPGTITPGPYRVGIEFTAAIERPDGVLNLHRVAVDKAKTVSIQRLTWIQASISNPRATGGRPSRISGKVQALHIDDDGDVSWAAVRDGTVRLSYDPDGPLEEEAEHIFVRELAIGSDGGFSTVVRARDRAWVLGYAGSDRLAPRLKVVLQGEDGGGCGC